ncbi:Protein BcsX [Pseudomonas sp. 8Z]|uniref:SGNH/GDSL hydrolase family protein n=1 Tax=Pseudomonas sp. 8Z TaxID=2653166 RepID=UPI0012F0DBE1|nr:SGNH/GDSL hydrolase family protein [Pseudomonas sp. 8Z]VXC43793.1 Protein BcsX [Pseudomonas sp. 8Z]
MAASLLVGLSILVVGDSNMALPGSLITGLHDDLTRRGAQVHSIGICGANAGDWLNATVGGSCGAAERRGDEPVKKLPLNTQTTPIKELIAQDKPDLVLVVMGDTMASYDKPSLPKTWIWQQTSSLTKAIAETKTACAWVGPNWGTEGGKYGKTYAKAKQMASFLSANVAPCTYIDSLKFSTPGQWKTRDGTHLTQDGYNVWGAAIANELEVIRKSRTN